MKKLTDCILRLFILVTLADVLLTACSEDSDWGRFRPGDAESVSVYFEVDGTLNESRAIPALEHECVLRNAVIMFFNTDNAASDPGKLMGYAYSEDITETSEIKFNVPKDVLAQNTDYAVLIAGNVYDYYTSATDVDRLMLPYEGMTRSEVMTSFSASHSAQIVKGRPAVLPLWGEMLDTDNTPRYFNYKVQESTGDILVSGKFKFWRAVVRIDIRNEVADQLDLRFVRVWNYRDQGYLFADGMYAGDLKQYDNQVDITGADPSFVHFERPMGSEQAISGHLYAFPNLCTMSSQTDKKTTCLLFGGVHKDDAETGTITWYRMNITNFPDAQSFKRNHVYRAVITGVKSRGYNTEKEAYGEGKAILEADTDTDWDENDDNVSSDSKGNFIILNKNRLSFSGNTAGYTTTTSTTGGSDTSDSESTITVVLREQVQVRVNPGNSWECVHDDSANDNASDFVFEADPATNTITFYPKTKNEGSSTRFAYYIVRTTNNPDVKVRMYVEQTSTKSESYLLTANGYPGTYGVSVDPNGEEINIEIRTGHPEVTWHVTNLSDFKREWDSNILCSSAGGDKFPLNIKIPAFICDQEHEDGNKELHTRTFELELKANYGNADADESEKTLVISLSQQEATDIITLLPVGDWDFDQDGDQKSPKITIEPFYTRPINDFEFQNYDYYPSGTANSRAIQVRLKNASSYNYYVLSDFSPANELMVSISGDPSITGYSTWATSLFEDNVHLWTNSSKNLASGYSGQTLHERMRTINNVTSTTEFYIHPFAMGPGDKPIRKAITIYAVHSSDASNFTSYHDISQCSKPVFTKSIDVILKAPDCIIDDVIILNTSITDADCKPTDGRHLLIADRYYGTPDRIKKSGRKMIGYGASMVSSVESSELTSPPSGVSIDEMYADEANFKNPSALFHTISKTDLQTQIDNIMSTWVSDQNDEEMRYSPFYQSDSSDKWSLGNRAFIWSLEHRVCYSKYRPYIVSDVKTPDGKYVCCWISLLSPSVSSLSIDSYYAGYFSYLLTQRDNIYEYAGVHMYKYTLSLLNVNNTSNQKALVRLSRFITDDELKEYKACGYPREQYKSGDKVFDWSKFDANGNYK